MSENTHSLTTNVRSLYLDRRMMVVVVVVGGMFYTM